MQTMLNVITVAGVIGLYVLSIIYARHTKKGKSGKYRFSYILNIIPMVVAVYVAKFQVTVSWLPNTASYAARFVVWTALLVLITRFLWTLFLQSDNDGLFLQGSHQELSENDDKKVQQVLNSQKLLNDMVLLLFDKGIRYGFELLKKTGYQEDKAYFYACHAFTGQIAKRYGEVFEAAAWSVSEIDRPYNDEIPVEHWKAIRSAREDREAVPYCGNKEGAQGLVFWAGHGVVIVVIRRDGLLNPNDVLHMWTAFDAFWSGVV